MTTTRIEAEDLDLSGSYGISSFSTASSGEAISLPRSTSTSGLTGEASHTFTGSAGVYDLDVGYFEEDDGGALIEVFVNGVSQGIIEIYSSGADSRPTAGSFAIESFSVDLNPGDVITLKAYGDNWSAAVIDYIELTGDAPANTAPIADGDNATTSEDNAVLIDVLAGDSDSDGGTLSVQSINTIGTLGQVTNNNTDVSYDPNGQFDYLGAGESATDSFVYTLSDDQGGTDTETVTVTITGIDDALVAADDTASVTEDGVPNPVTGNVLSNDSDPDDGPLAVAAADTGVRAGSYGSLTLGANGDFSYQLDNANPAVQALAAGATVTETFSYAAEHAGGSDDADLVVTIHGTDEAPPTPTTMRIEAEDLDLSGSYGISGFSISSSGQAISLPRSSSTTGLTGLASHTFAGSAGTYDLDVGYYKENDGGAIIDVAVNGVVQGTIAIYSSAADSRPTIDSFAIKSYSVALNPGDVITLKAFGNNWSDAVVDYIELTGDGPTNIAPVADADSATTNEDSAVVIDVLDGDYDTDGGTLGVQSVDTAATAGQIINNTTGVSYDPNGQFEYLGAGESATDSFTYTLSDFQGGTDTATVTVTVTGIDDPLVAGDDTAAVTEDTAPNPVTGNVLANDIDPDDGIVALAVAVSDTGARIGTYGTITLGANGDFSYQLDNANPAVQALAAGATVTETFSYTAEHAGGSDDADLVVTIHGTDEAPPTPTTMRIEAEDLDLSGSYGISSFSISSSGQAISLPRSSSTSGLTGLASHTFAGSAGTYDLDVGYYKENDGGAIIDVAVNGVVQGTIAIYSSAADSRPTTNSFNIESYSVALNPGDVISLKAFGNNWSDAVVDYIELTGEAPTNILPVADADSATTDEDSAVLIDVLDGDYDSDGGSLGVQSVDTAATLGIVTNNTTGVSYDPSGQFENLGAGESATDSFTYTVSDGQGGTDTATVTVTVTGIDDGYDEAYLKAVTGLAPMAYWRLSEAAGTAADDLVGGHDGIYRNGTALATESGPLPGEVTVTPHFDGSNDYVEAATDAAFDLPEGTFQIWMKSDAFGGAPRALVSSGSDGFVAGSILVAINADDSGQIAFRLQDDGADYFVFTPLNTIAADQWHHVAVSWGSGGMKIYVDGTLHMTNAFTGGVAFTGDPITIGASQRFSAPGQAEPTDRFFKGNLAEAAFFDEALGDAQITNLYDTGVSGGIPDIADDDVATTDKDSSVDIDVLDNDTGPATVTEIDTAGTAGSVVVNPDDTVTYDPNGAFDYLTDGETATDTFTYTIADGSGATSTATVTVTINTGGYMSTVTDHGPIAYWRLGEDAGTAADDLAGGHDGIYRNGTALATGDGPLTGEATVTPHFDGVNDYVEAATDAAFDLAEGTFQIWMRSDAFGGPPRALVSSGSDGFVAGSILVALNPDDSGQIAFRLQDDSADYFVWTPLDTITADQWHHVAVSWGSGGMKIYVDGALHMTKAFTGGVAYTGDPITIGASQKFSAPGQAEPTDRFFKGSLAEAAFFDEALTDIEIAELYDVGLSGGTSTSAADDLATTDNGASVDIDVLDNDVEPASVTDVDTTATAGTVVLNPDDTVTYDPNGAFDYLAGGETATDTFSYTITDSVGVTSTATVTVTVSGTGGYLSTISDHAPVAYWRLGEDTGTAADDLVGAHDGIYRNGTTLATASGPLGGEATVTPHFDGVNDYVEAATDASFDLPEGTFQVWMNSDAFGGAPRTLVSSGSIGFVEGSILVAINADDSGQIAFRLQDDSADYFVWTPLNTIAADQWHHVAVSWGSGGMKIYVDGTLHMTKAFTGGVAFTGDPITIGASQKFSAPGQAEPADRFFKGNLAEAAFFDEALSDTEIADLYIAGALGGISDVATDDLAATPKDASVDIDILDNDIGPVAVTDVDTTGTTGSVVVNPDDTITYDPNGAFDYLADGETATDSFTYTVESLGLTDTATVTVTVGEPAFAPDSIFGLSLWLDAADASSLTTSGSNVVSWQDKSGGNHHFTQSTSDYQPLLVDGQLNGLAAVRTDGSDDFLSADISDLSLNGMTLFLVAAVDPTDADAGIFSAYDSAAQDDHDDEDAFVLAADGSGGVSLTRDITDADPLSLTSLDVDSAPAILVAAMAAATAKLEVNGGDDVSDSYEDTDPTDPTGALLGARWADGALSSSNNGANDYHEILLYDHALSNQEILAVNTYLSNKWGLTVGQSDIDFEFVPFAGQSNANAHYTRDGGASVDQFLSDLSGFTAADSVSTVNASSGASSVDRIAAPTSSPEKYWWDLVTDSPGPLLTAAITEIKAHGATPTGIVWAQGEQDAQSLAGLVGTPTTIERYKQATEAVFDYFQSELGLPDLQFYIQQIGAYADAATQAAHHLIREAQTELANDLDYVHIAAATYDQSLEDNVHFTDESYVTIGARLARYIADEQGEAGVTYGSGPSLLSAQAQAANTEVIVTLTHDGGTDFTPTAAIDGFYLEDTTGAVTINTATKLSATEIKLTLDAALDGASTLHYVNGLADWDNNDIIVDNANPLSLPLETGTVDVWLV